MIAEVDMMVVEVDMMIVEVDMMSGVMVEVLIAIVVPMIGTHNDYVFIFLMCWPLGEGLGDFPTQRLEILPEENF